MTSSINTYIKMNGSADELTEMLKVIRYYENDLKYQYKENHDCPYISDDTYRDFTDEELKAEAVKCKGKMVLSLSGPYGVYNMLNEIGLFERLADAAPKAKFSGEISGFETGATIGLQGVLDKGKLIIREKYMPDNDNLEVEPDEYFDEIISRVPYERFVDLFKIDRASFSSEDYRRFIIYNNSWDDDEIYLSYEDIVDNYEPQFKGTFPDNMKYDQFISIFKTEITKQDYRKAKKEVVKEGFCSYYEYVDEIKHDCWSSKKTIYDPATGNYETITDTGA